MKLRVPQMACNFFVIWETEIFTNVFAPSSKRDRMLRTLGLSIGWGKSTKQSYIRGWVIWRATISWVTFVKTMNGPFILIYLELLPIFFSPDCLLLYLLNFPIFPGLVIRNVLCALAVRTSTWQNLKLELTVAMIDTRWLHTKYLWVGFQHAIQAPF